MKRCKHEARLHGFRAAKLAPKVSRSAIGALRLGSHSSCILSGWSSSVRAQAPEWGRKSSARWQVNRFCGDPRFEGGDGSHAMSASWAADARERPQRTAGILHAIVKCVQTLGAGCGLVGGV